ncbi:hypothetical protein [Streptomyces sp. NBC_01233]|uniref:hypothetical protein n=1 Tax=Streptomyces sp. NBC_01233 TaxID=2903787 RepID=UPI002E107DCE|nr:hypothetical protein OG332_41850 [Streptomyces sp. NBC_01233]
MFQNVDPARTCAYLLEQRHADYALSAKGNQAAPLAWVHAALPPAVPEAEEHVQTERSHGRIIRPSIWTAPLPDQLTLMLSWGCMPESCNSVIHSGRRIAK